MSQKLQSDEVAIVLDLWAQQPRRCASAGRDAVRLLRYAATAAPGLRPLWKALVAATKPKPAAQQQASSASTSGGVSVPDGASFGAMMAMRTPRRFLLSRLTTEMEQQVRGHTAPPNRRSVWAWHATDTPRCPHAPLFPASSSFL